MLLFLTDAHKQHLGLISEQTTPVFREVCQVALDFIKNGPNTKAIVGLSQKIDVPPENLRHAVEGLVKLLIESHRNKLSREDFSNSLEALGFQEEQKEFLNNVYAEEGKCFGVAGGLSVPPHFYNLDWRFEVQVASRSLLYQLTPLFTMRLFLKDGERPPERKESSNLLSERENLSSNMQCHTLQTDPVSLLHITGVLEQALAEGNSRHCRRVQHSLE